MTDLNQKNVTQVVHLQDNRLSLRAMLNLKNPFAEARQKHELDHPDDVTNLESGTDVKHEKKSRKPRKTGKKIMELEAAFAKIKPLPKGEMLRVNFESKIDAEDVFDLNKLKGDLIIDMDDSSDSDVADLSNGTKAENGNTLHAEADTVLDLTKPQLVRHMIDADIELQESGINDPENWIIPSDEPQEMKCGGRNVEMVEPYYKDGRLNKFGRLRAHYKDQVRCEVCGSVFRRNTGTQHRKTMKHQQALILRKRDLDLAIGLSKCKTKQDRINFINSLK